MRKKFTGFPKEYRTAVNSVLRWFRHQGWEPLPFQTEVFHIPRQLANSPVKGDRRQIFFRIKPFRCHFNNVLLEFLSFFGLFS